MTSIVEWEELSSQLERRCHDSLISNRVPFLQELLQLVRGGMLETPQLTQISITLLNSFVIYQDPESKSLVIQIFEDILKLDIRFLSNYSEFILEQVNKISATKALVDYLNLLEWIHAFLKFIAKDRVQFEQYSPRLLEAHTFTTYGVETILDNRDGTKMRVEKQNQHRKRIRHSILQSTTKTLVSCLRHKETATSYLSSIANLLLDDYSKLKLPISGIVLLLGAMTQSSVQLISSRPALNSLIKAQYAEKCCAFVGKEIIIGKCTPSMFSLEVCLRPFLKEFVTEKYFNTYLLPNVEKANLRTPELGFNILSQLYPSVNTKEIDLLHIFISSKIISQTFASFKSSKEEIRNASLQSVLTLLSSLSAENTSIQEMITLVDETFKNIKSNLNAEYKFFASKILANIPTFSKDVSTKVSTGLSAYLLKEANEATLSCMLDACFVNYFSIGESNVELNKIIANGFKEKKPNLKKMWFCSFLINSKNACREILEAFEDDSMNFCRETLIHPQRHGQVSILACFEFMDRVFTFNKSDLQEKTIQLINSLPDSSLLGRCFLEVTLSTTLSASQRLRSVELLQAFFQREPEIVGLSTIESLEQQIQKGEIESQDTVSYRFIVPVLNSISQSIPNTATSKKILVHSIIIAQYDKFAIKNNWAGLVLHAKLDPAQILKEHAEEVIDKVFSILNNSKWVNSAYSKCAVRAAAYTSFINSPAIAPLLSKILETDLEVDELSKYTSQDLKIWAGKEGEMVIDVLETDSAKHVMSKNSKDYETLKWEESIRKEQAKRNSRKLTKAQQDLVKEQLAKESALRNKISKTALQLKRSMQLIRQLAREAVLVDNGSAIWFPVVVGRLLKLTQQANTIVLIGDSARDAFLDLSLDISNRLGVTRFFIGIAILRVHQVTNISNSYLEEPLPDLLSRVLFRVKFVSDQSPLDPISLTYLLPLLINVLEEGRRVALKNADKPVSRNEFVEEDKEEEHLLLAMDIISAHAEAFADPSIPRMSIMQVLLALLALPSKAKMAKECFNALCQSISVAPTDKDLQLLLSSLLYPNQFVRSTILQAIDNEFELAPLMEYSPEIFICKYDSDDTNRSVADFIWEFNKFKIVDGLQVKLITFFNQSDSGLRLFTARAYAAATGYLKKSNSRSLHQSLDALMKFYLEKAQPVEPIVDDFGLVVVSAAERKDPWEERSTVAIAFNELVVFFEEDGKTVVNFIKFLVEQGALGDREPLVRQEMKEAGIETITKHGASNVEALIPIFEASLMSSIGTSIKENVIILYGSLARHLHPDDERIHTIISRLLSTLDTPSSDVQQAVSACLSPLVFLFRPKVEDYINSLMERLLDPTVAVHSRKGAAWGMAGLVKGYGISCLSKFDIIRNLIEAAEDKKDSKRRESVAYAFEYLSKSLGKFFEPYVIEVLPNILKNLGDAVPEVRDATADATKAIMAHTTSFGVMKLIPVAVSNLDEISWRTKRGSVELLGNMAYLDPTQLSSSLSTIVPEIVGVLNDSHKEVRRAADESLKRFGEVIRNPEIQKLVPTLIRAIGDPTKYTDEALDALIQTQFVHYIDGPSLALIIHVIHRGMHDRSANTKRKACKIVGNMAILVDTKDLIPYLQQLIDEVEIAMVDPVPSTRATAARALGALVERLGEEQFPDLITRLLDTLADESKSGDRLGSAQALAEVINGLGLPKLDELLPTILAGVTSYRAYIREGYMPLLLFIPVCFGPQFAPYISQIIQPILAGLADNDENIRDTALKAGKLIVKNYAMKAIDLLLPELERGMFDENERIRLSSVQLSGELLFQVTGISSKNEFNEEEVENNGEVTRKMVEVLGEERRNRILSALFVCRNDTSGIVRATTVDIWKALVPNTPRTVKEILPTLISMIVVHLASSSGTLRNIAAQTLGDMVRRVGGNALSQLLPTLENFLDETSSPDSRQGICIALRELMESSSAETLSEYQPMIVNILRNTLVDSAETVRHAAALCFDTYQDVVGKVAVDEVLPYLLHLLESSDDSECALFGLQEIMSTKSEIIFPILIPTLLHPPIDTFRASALGSLAAVAGSALYRRLSTIINSLVNALVSINSDEATREALEAALDKVFLSVTEGEGLHPLLQEIMSLLKSEDIEKRAVVLQRLPNFFEKTVLDYSVYATDIVSNAILSLDDRDSRIVRANFEALSILLAKQDKSSLDSFIKPAKQALQMTGQQGQDLAAFALPKGPSCVLPIFLHGLMYGSSDEREDSALGIADLVSKTPTLNLKPFVSTITGPLIRVVGERFNGDIKAAILYALNILFSKVPQFLRPFIPQLQRTFVKSLTDPSNELLRLRAAKALGTLIEYQPRVDPLVLELVSGAKQTTDEGVKTAILKAILEVIEKAGSKLNETSKSNIVNLVEEEILSTNDKLAVAYAKLIGSVSEILSTEEVHKILKEKVLLAGLVGDSSKFGILTLNSFLRDVPHHILNTNLVDSVVEYIIEAVNSPNVHFSDNGLLAAGKLLLLENEKKSPFSKTESHSIFELGDTNLVQLMDALCKAMLDPISNSLDSRRLSLVVVRTLARFKFEECIRPYLDKLGPSIFSCLRDTIIPIKLAAEKAYLATFRLVEEEDMETFNTWFSKVSCDNTYLSNAAGINVQLRSIGDYTKRVGKRLATVERERISEGGDPEAMFSDRFEDEKEIWAVGGVELNEDI